MNTNSNEKITPEIVSIFSGCGGLDWGFHLEGYKTVWANDFAEWAVESFKENFGDVIHYGDITQNGTYASQKSEGDLPEIKKKLVGKKTLARRIDALGF
ncbi:MAG: DNA cytosine methyltransferase, partial [Oscillospiraceae bacterium]|nr:DNA cytosine methyltransferase [Oscillospiraceae bacterium]